MNSLLLGVLLIASLSHILYLFFHARAAARKKRLLAAKRASTPAQSMDITVAAPATAAERVVDRELQTLELDNFIVFNDLIIPTGLEKITLTQIDHVIVSTYGIFCIETKSNQGNIYGYSKNRYWMQYLGSKQYGLYSPYRQNDFHVRSLEKLLSNQLKAPIHSYVTFPNAHKVMIDGETKDMSITGVIARINQHTNQRYDVASIERIAKSLAHIASKREDWRGRHLDEVRRHVNDSVKPTLRYSRPITISSHDSTNGEP